MGNVGNLNYFQANFQFKDAKASVRMDPSQCNKLTKWIIKSLFQMFTWLGG